MSIEAAAAILSAVGTVAAVLVALFLPEWQRAKTRPIVTLQFDPGSYDIAFYDRDPWVGVWFRFRVHNRAGRDTAREVRVVVKDVQSVTGGSLPKNTLALRDLSWAEIGAAEIDIPAGMSRRIDVAHVDKRRTPADAPGKPWPALGLGLAMWPRHFDDRDFLGVGEFILTLVVGGDNFDASEWHTRVSFDDTGLSDASPLDEIRTHAAATAPVLLYK